METPPKRKQLVVVGLGNPGKQYQLTRHNFGQMVVEELAQRCSWALKTSARMQAAVAHGPAAGGVLHLVVPTTYMNRSGLAVRRYLDYYKLSNSSLLVLSDDTALPFGQMRLREGGSAGGHNGLKDIQAHLGTQKYTRMRLGVGERGKMSQSNYVLAPFSKEEQQELPLLVAKAAQLTWRLLTEPLADVMQEANQRLEPMNKREEAPSEGAGEKNHETA